MSESKNTVSRESILFGIIGFLLGIVLTLLLVRNAVNNNMTGMMRMMGIHERTEERQEFREEMAEHMMKNEMSMDEMVLDLKDKISDDFDKAFITLMVDHHQGAIEMANLAKVSAKHQEIKDLADDIISAQTSEIEMMENWEKTWGY